MSDRRYFHSSKTGDRGYLVERDGVLFMRLDRPNEEILRSYNENEWIPDVEQRPMSKGQLAKICFEADKALCQALGLYKFAQKQWLDLSDKERIAWMEKGPQGTPERKLLWSVLQATFAELTRA